MNDDDARNVTVLLPTMGMETFCTAMMRSCTVPAEQFCSNVHWTVPTLFVDSSCLAVMHADVGATDPMRAASLATDWICSWST